MSLMCCDKLWGEHVVYSEDDDTQPRATSTDRQLAALRGSQPSGTWRLGLGLASHPAWRVSASLSVSDHNVPTADRSEGAADPVSKMHVVDTLGQGSS